SVADRCASTARSPASTTAFAASSSSWAAFSRCSAASGPASKSAATAASAESPSGGCSAAGPSSSASPAVSPGAAVSRSRYRSPVAMSHLHELDFEPPVRHTGLRDLAPPQAVGQHHRAPVRADGDEKLTVAAAQLDVGAVGERQLHRQHQRVALCHDAERLDERQSASGVVQSV